MDKSARQSVHANFLTTRRLAQVYWTCVTGITWRLL